MQDWQGRGLATEALTKVLEKSGMQLINTEKDGIAAGGRTYDKLIYEYRAID